MLSQSKIWVICLLAILVTLGEKPSSTSANLPAVAPRNVCEGFQDPPIPSLAQEPLFSRAVPASSDFIPLAIADWDNDGDFDTQFAENLGGLRFRYVPTIDDLIELSGYGTLIRQNYKNRQTSLGLFPRLPLDELYYNFHGVAAVDFDDDGLTDLIVAPYAQAGVPIMLFHNLGNWQFEFSRQDFFTNLLDFSDSSVWHSETIIIADLSGDGLHDIYIPFYTYTTPYQSIFLRNMGNGYAEEAVQRGIGIPNIPWELRPEGAQAVDIDDDGDLDIYVAHHLFINDGAGYFTDLRELYGLPIVFDEGIAFIDYDNDGLLDLYIRTSDTTILLFHNTGNGFTNTTVSSGIACLARGLPFYEGDAWGDFNSDGYLDLLYTFDEHTPRYALFLNQGNGTFQLGFTGSRFIQLPATVDIDFDGDLDVISMNGMNENVLPKRNNTAYLAIIPVDDQGKENEYGTTIKVKNRCNNQVQTRVIGTNNVFLSQGQYAAHFAVATDCAHEIQTTFPKKGILSQKTIVIPYSPIIENSLRIFVNRNTFTKKPYTIPTFFFPYVSKEK